jgi:putative ABC transport system permease protein
MFEVTARPAVRLAWRGIVAQRLRFALTTSAVALSVAFVAATLVLSSTIGSGIDRTFGATGGDVVVRAAAPDGQPGPPLPAGTQQAVADVPGVQQVFGELTGPARLVLDDGTAVDGNVVLGSADGLGSASPFSLSAGEAPGPGTVVVDAATARGSGIALGDEVDVAAEGSRRSLTVSGLVELGDLGDADAGTSYLLADLSTAQRLLDRVGEVDQVTVAADHDMDASSVAADIEDAVGATVPAGTHLEAVPADQAAQEAKDLAASGTAIITGALSAFSAISLFVGALIIANTFAIVVAQRSRELAALRAIGATRRQVRRTVLIEALVIGLVGSVVGAGLGVLLATGLKSTLSIIGLELPSTGVVVEAGSLFYPALGGVAFTVAAALVPAIRAGRLAPVEAMRASQATWARPRVWRLVVGVALVAGSVLGGLLTSPLVLLALVVLGPWLVGPIARLVGLVGARFGMPGKLARQNALRNPRRTAATATALTMGLAVVAGMAVLGASASKSFNQALDRSVGADVIVDSETGLDFSAKVERAVASVPGIEAVSPQRTGQVDVVSADLPNTDIEAIDANVGDLMNVGASDQALAALDDGGVLVLDSLASKEDWAVGDTVDIRFPLGGVRAVRVDGFYTEDTLYPQGFLLSMTDYVKHFPVQRDIRVLASVSDGADAGATRSAVEQATADFPGLVVTDRAGYQDRVAGQVDQLLAVVAILLALAIVVAVLGVVNTLALSITERMREVGLLRAVGMTRRQVRSMVRWESITIGVMGAALGVAAGVYLGWAMVAALDSQGFTELALPGTRLVLFVVAGVAVGIVAAIGPARRASRADVLEAIAST